MNKDKNYSKRDEVIGTLLRRISAEQEMGSPIFGGELFPSYRSNTAWGYKRPDSNIFASLSVLFVLQNIKEQLPNNLYETLAEKVLLALPKYQNMHGGDTYNFWETKPSRHFPHGRLLGKFKHFKLPDDIDDTALAFLVKGSSIDEVAKLRIKIEEHSQAQIGNKPFAYNTWFGEHMPYEHDVCALSNLMYLFHNVGLKPVQSDNATIDFLAKTIEEGNYLIKPFEYARHYGSAPLIIYHLARLMSTFSIPALDSQKENFVSQARDCLESAKLAMDQVLLTSSLMKLGYRFNSDFDLKQVDEEHFSPFIGAPFAPYGNEVFRMIASHKLAVINWECDALKWAYCLENLMLGISTKS